MNKQLKRFHTLNKLIKSMNNDKYEITEKKNNESYFLKLTEIQKTKHLTYLQGRVINGIL